MPNRVQTIFQGLAKTLNGWNDGTYTTNVKDTGTDRELFNTYSYDRDEVILRTTDKAEYERALLQGKQSNWLSNKFYNAAAKTSVHELQSLNFVDLMYRDVELMSNRPEIYQALNVVANETCTLSDDGSIINIYSTSDRIKHILEDLFFNRLQLHVEGFGAVRSMLKYGNEYRLMNITADNGVLGWKQLPVAEVKRFSNQYPYGFAGQVMNANTADKEHAFEPHFEWMGNGIQSTIHHWQMAHFRLLNDTICLPYGASYLLGARQQWRRLTQMEDAILIYIWEKAFERFVYKIDVGLIDPADVPQKIQDIANKVKRTIQVDPKTGQLNLNRSANSVIEDIFIPVRGEKDGTKIETISSGGNLDKLKDILEYVHLQLLTALGVPKLFLNFEASAAEGKNLSLVDVRFAKMVNRVQQCFIMELNKIAITHLYLMGFHDELNNFTITMNNPSMQSEILRVEELQKKILAIKDGVGAATEGGLPIYSWKKALRDIMKFSDKEIEEILSDIRLEKAISGEIQLTNQIIKKTGVFDKVDNLYGEPGAEYDYSALQDDGGGAGGMGGGGGGGMDLGGGLGEGDIAPEGGDIGGEPETGSMESGGEAPPPAAVESKKKGKLLTKSVQPTSGFINEEYNNTIQKLDAFIKSQQNVELDVED